jgi:hypothetical protein
VPATFALAWLAVWPLVAGCQSGAQQDLIARELRMHEDQIYAMEDYLTQYQQLVCKYRSENEALRRRLADEYYDGDALPAPRQTPRTGGGRTAPPSGTSIEIRETPGREGQQAPPREIEIEVPDVPPLEGSTSDESTSQEIVRAVHLESRVTGAGAAAIDEAASGQAASAAGKPHPKSSIKPTGMARAQKIVAQSPPPLRLHGEVHASQAGGGPRFVVNVEPLDELETGPFEGEASLMLLAPKKPRHQQRLARWDFGGEDVKTAREDAGDDHALRFYLELPATTPIDPSTELWVRLVPRDGEKLLAHTKVDLSLPGRFASSTASGMNEMTGRLGQGPGMSRESRVDAPGAPPIRTQDGDTASLLEGDWSIARPGQPANLPRAEELLMGGWRTSSEPIAEIAQASAITKPDAPVVLQASHVENGSLSKPARTYKRPTWSPDRGSVSSANSDDSATRATASKRPPWSATR